MSEIDKNLPDVLRSLNPYMKLKFRGTMDGKKNPVHQVRWFLSHWDFRGNELSGARATIKSNIYREGRIDINVVLRMKQDGPCEYYRHWFEEV